MLRVQHALKTVLPRQVHSTQRNIAANTQRKFVTAYCVPAGYEGGPLTGTPPVEMTGVLMTSVSPSGALLPPPVPQERSCTASSLCQPRGFLPIMCSQSERHDSLDCQKHNKKSP